MFNWFGNLPEQLVGSNVLGMLGIRDIVMLERACGSKASHQHFMKMIPYCAPVKLPGHKRTHYSAFQWFSKRKCKIKSLSICLPGNNPCLHVENLQVNCVDLNLQSIIKMEDCRSLCDSNLVCYVKHIFIYSCPNEEVMEELSLFARKVEKLTIFNLDTNNDWINSIILSRWKLKDISLYGTVVIESIIKLVTHVCTELTSIKLDSSTMDDAVVAVIAQHCPQLETLPLRSGNITWKSLLALSERGLPLKELEISNIPYIPTADIARRCSHVLSCIRHLNTNNLHLTDQDASILIPYMTELTSVRLENYCYSYIPLLKQHCNKLIKIYVYHVDCTVSDILSLCCANPLLQELNCRSVGFTDTALIELIHACPHLHTLRLPYETAITDIGMLALSEYCPQLQCLYIGKCKQVTDAAVIQLL